jgi:hypothetical protein
VKRRQVSPGRQVKKRAPGSKGFRRIAPWRASSWLGELGEKLGSG